MTPRVLIVEDEGALARSIRRSLEREGLEVAAEESGERGLEALSGFDADVVLLDLLLPGMSGFDFLRALRAQGRRLPVIAMSAHAAVRSAVEAMRLGSYDYLAKPLDLLELKALVARAVEHGRRSRLALAADQSVTPAMLLGDDRAVAETRSRLQRIAQMERRSGGGAPPVLIAGEPGTGKRLAARILHHAGGRGARGFVEVHCATLVEAALVGAEGPSGDPVGPGGLLEAAEGGTLFLDDVTALDAATQATLLDVIERRRFRPLGAAREREVDVRVVAASPARAVWSAARVLPALSHHLDVLAVTLPPLRERGEDVGLLAEHFARRHAEQYGMVARPLSPHARELLGRHAWPGNVRELLLEVEHGVLLETGDALELDRLRAKVVPVPRRAALRADATDLSVDLPPEGVAFELIERSVIARTLEMTDGNVTRAARLLGLSRDTLRYRIERLDL